MMNPEDALRALEDQQIYNNIYNATADRLATKQINKEIAVLDRMTAKIAELRGLLKAANEKIEVEVQRNNTAVAVGNSAVLALKDATEEIAFLKDVPLETIAKPINVSRTKHLNKIINQFIENGTLKADPRISGEMKKHAWYVSGLDPEHGV